MKIEQDKADWKDIYHFFMVNSYKAFLCQSFYHCYKEKRAR